MRVFAFAISCFCLACVGRTSLYDALDQGDLDASDPDTSDSDTTDQTDTTDETDVGPGDGDGGPIVMPGLPHILSSQDAFNPNGLGVDDSGAIVVGATFANPWTGTQFDGTLTIDGEATSGRTGGTEVVFVRWKLNGTRTWTHIYGGATSNVDSRQLAVAADGSWYGVGILNGTMDVQGTMLDGGSAQSPAILLHGADGTFDARSRVFRSVNANVQGVDIRVASGGYVSMTGQHSLGSTVDLGGGNITTAQADPNVFMAVFRDDLSYVWQRAIVSAAVLSGPVSAPGPDGSAYFAFKANGAVDLGSGNLTANGGIDIALARYDSTGAPSFTRLLGGMGNDVVNRVVRRSGGGAVLVGATSAGFTADSLVVGGRGGDDGFVLVLASNGGTQQVLTIGAAGNETCYDVALDSQENLYVAGSFQGVVDFGGQVLDGGASSGFLASYTANGTLRWVRRAGGASAIARVAVHEASESVWVYGGFSDAVELDGVTFVGATNSAFVYRWATTGETIQ